MKVWIPMPLQIVIDDVGWWCGRNDGASADSTGPFRTGMGRDHVPEDYQALVSLGKALGMRPQAAMVLCEWDRTNLLRRVPSSTWMGEHWENRSWVGPRLDEAAEILNEGRDHLEVTLHGIGHEYWENGRRSRAEWHDKRGHMRPREAVEAHLDAYFELLEQNGICGNIHSFVPCAFLHALGDGDEGFAEILKKRGIRYISTPFVRMRKAKEPEDRWFGIDHGIITVDRGDAGIRWDRVAAEPPTSESGEINLPLQPILGLHWPNILHPDPARNEEVVEQWISAIASIGELPHRVLSADTPSCWTQLAYHRMTELYAAGGQERRAEEKPGETGWITLSPGQDLLLDFSKVDALGSPEELGIEDTFTLRYQVGATGSSGPAALGPEAAGCTILSDTSDQRENRGTNERGVRFRTLVCKRNPEARTATLRLRKKNRRQSYT